MQPKQKSILNKKTASLVCNVLKRQFQVNFNDFTPVMIIYEGNNLSAAIESKARKIQKHPAGRSILENIRNYAKNHTGAHRTQFYGFADYHRRGFFGLMDRHQSICVFFINLNHFSYEFELKAHVLHLLWHATTLREDFLRKNNKILQKGLKPSFYDEDTFDIQNDVIRPKLSPELMFKRNLMADIFAACMLYLNGNTEAPRQLASMRMKESLTPRENFIAERYPFAVSDQTLMFVLDNSQLIHNRPAHFIQIALNITKDIGENYTIPATEQWKNFSQPAQHLAWIGSKPEIILGTAIYTSESPYVRSIADMALQYTNIEPEIITSVDDFNPFIGKERAKNEHRKKCSEIFRKLIVDASVNSDASVFFEEARKQNQKMMTGNPFGWCAYGILRLANSYKEEFAGRYDLSQKSRIEELFEISQKEVPYETILKFSILVFQKRRSGQMSSLDDLMRLAQATEEFKLIASAIEESGKGVLDIFKKTA